ncbi:MAG: hypothetical protein WBC37_12455, partial [Burkholderiaceae bacterium]
HIIEEARRRGYKRLSLETGSMEAFRPAWRLYESFGFQYGGPFRHSHQDALPNSKTSRRFHTPSAKSRPHW